MLPLQDGGGTLPIAQWFVKIKPLAEPAIQAVEDGRVRIIPDGWKNNYLGWMRDIKDWCISRQIWWGHQIPAWYCETLLWKCISASITPMERHSCPVRREAVIVAKTKRRYLCPRGMRMRWCKIPTCWIPGFPPPSGPSRPWDGRSRRGTDKPTIPLRPWSRASTSSFSGSPA